MKTITDCFNKEWVTKNYVLVTLFLLLFSFTSRSQVFWTEDFTSSCAGNNCSASLYPSLNGFWGVSSNASLNGVNNNQWYVSNLENGDLAGACATGAGTDASLHIGANTNVLGLGDQGATFFNGGLGLDPLTDIRVESPIIDCSGKTNITVSFNYIENGDGTNDNATLMYFDGVSWSVLFDLAKTALCSPAVGTWTAYTQSLPASADNNALVQIGFRWVNNDDALGDDPSIAVDDITLSSSAPSSNTIATGVIAGSPFCGCDAVSVPFTSVGTFNAPNIYTAQISDASGSFTSAVTIGTLTSTANNGTVIGTIPCGTLTGAGYLVRVISSDPVVTGTSNGVNITVNAAAIASLSLSTVVSGGTICNDTAVFTVTPANGGTNPTYQWQLNGVNVGTDSTSYYPNAVLLTGDTVSVTMISNAACAAPASVVVDTVVNCVAVVTGPIPGISFCACDSVYVPFTSIGDYAASNIYTAQLSDSTGSFASTVIIGTLTDSTNAGIIACQIPCAALTGSDYVIKVISSSPVVSDTTSLDTIAIIAVVVPLVSISTTETTALCIDTAVTFTATATNGGSAPMYQWQRNGVNVGTNSPTYTTSGMFLEGEIISVLLTSNAPCAVPATSQALNVVDCPAIAIPNVFTPNGDGLNDLFKINLSGESLGNFDLNIYDRWGILIFTSTSINNKWDGRTTAGLKVKDGTYFYVVNLNTKQYKGFVSVFQSN
ncbi:MAG: gliding motility-associated C-terminal domain-containing protein [Bacteroidota bacterium]